MSEFKCDKCGKILNSARGKALHEKYCGNEEAKKALGEKIAKGLNGGGKKKKTAKKGKSGPESTRTSAKQMKVKHTYRCKPRGKKETREEMLTPLKAIRRFCEECNGWQELPEAIQACHVEVCPLYPFRMEEK
jgi:hypothetical protein